MRIFAAALVALLAASSASQAQPWEFGAWRNRVEVEITEPGVTARTDEYVDLLLVFSSGPTANLANDIRVTDSGGTELPRIVYAVEAPMARVLFPLPSLPLGATETVFVYWGNDTALAPIDVFPPIPVVFYSTNVATPHPDDQIQIDALGAMNAHGEIPVTVTIADGDSQPYDRDQALVHRVAGIGVECGIHSNLNTTTLYQDLSLWGFTDGNCLEARIFGLTDITPDPSTEARVPMQTSYVTQDFAPDELLAFLCAETAEADAGATLELLASETAGCHISWEAGHTLPNGETLGFRSFFTGTTAFWSPDQHTINRRSMEYLLQDNRVSVVFPNPPELRSCTELPASGCGIAAKSSLSIKNSSTNGKDKLTWKFQKSVDAIEIADLGDPVAGSGQFSLCVYDHSGDTPELAEQLVVGAGGTCGTKPCWKANGKGTALKYKDKAAVADGIQKVQIKTGPPSKGKLQLTAKGVQLDFEPFSGVQFFEQDGEVLVQLLEVDGGCWESRFDAAQTKKNTPDAFKAVAK